MTIRYQTAVYSTLVFLVLFFGIVTSVQGQALNQEQFLNQGQALNLGVALQNAEIVSQEGGEISLAFDFVNGGAVQTGVKYTVELSREAVSGKALQTIIDSHTYAETLTLSPNSTTHKEIVYSAPEHMSGDYTVWLRANNTNGYFLGMTRVGTATLSGSDSYVEIVPESCFTEVQNDDNKYPLSEIAGAFVDESITTTCTLINHTDNDVSLVPQFITKEGSRFGNVVEGLNNLGDQFTLEAGEEKEITFKIDKSTIPKTYTTSIFLKNSNGSIFSNSIDINYIVGAVSAATANVTFDKESYKEGDVIKATISIRRVGPLEDNDLPTLLDIKIVDKRGVLCGDPLIGGEVDRSFLGTQISITATRDCNDPEVVTTLTVGDKVIFEGTTRESDDEGGFSGIVVGAIIALLLAVALRAFLKKKGKTTIPLSVVMMIIVPLVAIGVFTPRTHVEAYTVWGCVLDGGYANSLDTGKEVYKPGETITVTGSYSSSCTTPPSVYEFSIDGATPLLSIPLTLITGDGFTTTGIYSGTTPAPSSQDLHHLWGYSSLFGLPEVFAPFVVISEATASISASPSSIPSGSSTSITWGSINATGCTGGGTGFSTGGISGGTDTTVGPISTDTTYSVSCSGGIDLGIWNFVREDPQQLYTEGVLSYPAPGEILSLCPFWPNVYDGALDNRSATAFTCYNTGYDVALWVATGNGATVVIYDFTPNSVFIAGNVALASKTVTVTASSGTISVTPSPLAFGAVTVLTTASKIFTISNTGGTEFSGSITGLAAPYSCSGGCSYTVPAGGSVTKTIIFAPTAVTSYPDTAVFSGGGGTSKAVSGTGELVTQVISVTANTVNPLQILTGDNVTISWTSEGATTCSGTNFTISPNTKTGNPIADSETINNITADTIFRVTCFGEAGGDDFDDVLVTIVDPQPSIIATPSRVLLGASSLLSWSAQDVTSCTLNNSSGDAVSSGISGSYTTPSITAEVTYTLTCVASLGPPPTVSASVTIRPFTPIFEEI